MTAYLSESLDMVGQLPGRLAVERDPVVAYACLEACLVHVRLLAEFLVRRPERDFSALDFLWPVPSSPAAKRLRTKWWDVASQQVVHFSRNRIPEDVQNVEVVEDVVAWLCEAATDVFSVAEEFVEATEALGHREAGRLRWSLTKNKQRLAVTLADPDRKGHAAVRMPLP